MKIFARRNGILIAAALCADMIIGDPEGWPHPVRLFGKEIELLERVLRKETDEPEVQRAKGALLTAAVAGSAAAGTAGLMRLARAMGKAVPIPLLNESIPAALAGTVLGTYCLASKSLADAADPVYEALRENDIARARKAVGMIVGRDTQALTFSGIAKAAVESVAESTADGIVAPLFWMALGGPAGGMFYKAVNTMDSMIGYKNDKYRYFGTAAARLDDLVNLVPSRIAAFALIGAAKVLGENASDGVRIFKRDRYNHKSPNSAQTESAMAGILGLRLGGDAYYFGKLVKKPTIGDGRQEAGPEEIRRAVRLMYAASILAAGALGLICVMTKD